MGMQASMIKKTSFLREIMKQKSLTPSAHRLTFLVLHWPQAGLALTKIKKALLSFRFVRLFILVEVVKFVHPCFLSYLSARY